MPIPRLRLHRRKPDLGRRGLIVGADVKHPDRVLHVPFAKRAQAFLSVKVLTHAKTQPPDLFAIHLGDAVELRLHRLLTPTFHVDADWHRLYHMHGIRVTYRITYNVYRIPYTYHIIYK